MNKKLTVKKAYDKSAEFYEQRYETIQKIKFKQILENITKKDIIFDLGCGTSLILLNPKLEKTRYIGIDISSEMIREAKKKQHYYKELIIADVENTPIKNNCVTAATVFTVLQNLPSYSSVIKEIKRITDTGGEVYFSVLKKKFDEKKFSETIKRRCMKILKKIEVNDSEDIGIVIVNT